MKLNFSNSIVAKMSFKEKVVLITGASSGIGAGTAQVFAERGANVILVGRNIEKLKASEAKCKATNKDSKTLIIQADVNTDSEKIINETIAKFHCLDVLVNNAGIASTGYFMESDISNLDKYLNTNLRAVYKLTQLAVPHLLKSQGNIVNVSSVAGILAVPSAFNYSISKAALDQFTKLLAQELAPQKVRVNSVNPAVIATDLLENAGWDKEKVESYYKVSVASHPIGRIGNVNDVAKTIAFLASDDAGFITGSLIAVDGGRVTLAS